MAGKASDDLKKGHWLVYLIGCVLAGVGLFFHLIFSSGVAVALAQYGAFLTTLGAGGLLAFAAFANGTLFGLIFGIPRSRKSGQEEEVKEPNTAPANSFLALGHNNNLVEISDWLTKVIVGATLTQVIRLPSLLAAFGTRFGSSVGGEAVAIFLLTGFSAAGFLFGYLFTRLVLPRALHDAGITTKEKGMVLELEGTDPAPPVADEKKGILEASNDNKDASDQPSKGASEPADGDPKPKNRTMDFENDEGAPQAPDGSKDAPEVPDKTKGPSDPEGHRS